MRFNLRRYCSSCDLSKLEGRMVGIPGINILSSSTAPHRLLFFFFLDRDTWSPPSTLFSSRGSEFPFPNAVKETMLKENILVVFELVVNTKILSSFEHFRLYSFVVSVQDGVTLFTLVQSRVTSDLKAEKANFESEKSQK